MQDGGGGWLQPPPSWPCISGEAGGPANMLPAYLDFAEEQQQQQEQQQQAQQQAWQQHDGRGLDVLAAAAADPLGVLLPEPAFLAAFGAE